MSDLINEKYEDLLTEPPSSELKSIIQCHHHQCGHRFIRDCHILRHLRFRKCDNTQKNIQNHENVVLDQQSLKMNEKDCNNCEFYKCEFCGITYNHPSAFNRHINFHTAERKFKCSVCGDRFTQKIVLNSHIHSQHNKTKNKCEVCKYEFKNLLDLNIHMSSRHSVINNRP